MAEMIHAIRSGTWKKQAAEKKEARALRVLDDIGEERFAQLVGSGERTAYAYQKVYDVPRSTALVEGHHLAREPHVAQRIAQIRQAGSAESGWTRTMRMRYLREFAATPIGEIDLNSQFCQGVRRTLHGEEFLTPDKLKAVALYSALAKIQKEKKPQTIEEAIKGMRSRGNERAAHGTENSLIHYVYDMVG